MRKIKLDGKKIETIDELHAFFKAELNFPNYYGVNLDALWDCLTEGFEEPTKIIWINVEDSRKRLGKNFVADVIDLLKESKEYMKNYPEKFDYELYD